MVTEFACWPGSLSGCTYGGLFSETESNGARAMATYSLKERDVLLKTARAAISAALEADRNPPAGEAGAFPAFREKRGCFVTLHKAGRLRGCIGTIEPVDALVDSVKDNALKAAFDDPRFSPVKADELPQIEIEISVLTPPKSLDHIDTEDLLRKLKPGVHGVILSRERHAATFLPQVWEQLPRKESFLSNLSAKAGLPEKAWQDKKTKIKVYEVEYFSESHTR